MTARRSQFELRDTLYGKLDERWKRTESLR